MAAEGKFAHISVSSDDEDDFVIQAGAPAADSEVRDDGEGDAGSDRAHAASAEVLAAPAESARGSEAVRDSASVRAGGEFAETKSSSPGSAGSAGSVGSADRSYRETTLEDLESAPMSTMQKGVIVAAVLAIVAFVVWYVVLR